MPALLDRMTSAFASRYPIERELGRGGMATVYLAHDPKHGRLPVSRAVFRSIRLVPTRHKQAPAQAQGAKSTLSSACR
jgi:serine/threonine protein kinase